MPASVGVPVITPLSQVKPGGIGPLTTVKVIGSSPVAWIVRVRAWPTVPTSRIAFVVMVGGTAATSITRVNVLSVKPATLVALTVNVNVPWARGVPEIIPVALAKLNPDGRVEPLVNSNVIGAVPVTSIVRLRAWPTVPLPRPESVVIVGETGAGSTVIVIECVTVEWPWTVAVIVVVPNPIIVARPVVLTVATVVSLDVQLRVYEYPAPPVTV